MPVYPEIGVAFIHVPKTAGATIRSLLDAYTQARSDRLWRRISSNLPYAEPLDRVHIRMHDSAAWVRRKLGAPVYEKLFSFAVVRDPYDRAISEYEFLRQSPTHRRHLSARDRSFADFLKAEPTRRALQIPLITDRHDRIIVTEIVRHEDFADAINTIFARIGIPERLGATRVNVSKREPREHYLTEEVVRIINQRNARDFAALGYPLINL